MAELMLGQPLFPGESGIDQLVEIIKVLGTPTREQIRTMNPNYMEHKFPQIKPHPFSKVFDICAAKPNRLLILWSRSSEKLRRKQLILFQGCWSTPRRNDFRPSRRYAIHSSTNCVIRTRSYRILAEILEYGIYPRCSTFQSMVRIP